MEFRLLGPVEVALGAEPCMLVSRQKIVLSLLLLDANHVVSIDRLIDGLWNDEPPRTARAQVQITISSLRQILGVNVVITRHPGYLIRVAPEALDLACFEMLRARARTAVEEQRPLDAARDLRSAIALWRGSALEGIQSEVIRTAATRLNERRISTYQECLELELQLGKHYEIIAELTELTAEYPLDERFRGQLMLALYRAGRQADALEVFRAGRDIMREDLGLNVGAELRHLEQAILSHDKQLDAPGAKLPSAASPKTVGALIPRQLPRTVADFTGREEIIAEICLVMAGQDSDGSRPDVPVVVLTGRGGMGKTTLATRTAHLLSPDFPDGQIFLQLRPDKRHTSTSLLEQLLRSTGVHPNAIPPDLDGRAALYRSLLAGRRVLVVIDGAIDAEDIIPLLPGTRGCAALITTAHYISGLDGVHQIYVGRLDVGSAEKLLTTLIGQQRASAEPDALRELVRLCEGIPLALRVVAAKLNVRRHWRIAHMVVQLADETRRLDELDSDGASMRATLALVYESLAEPTRQLLCRLSLLGMADFASWVCAPLLDTDIDSTEDLLQQLVTSHLVEVNVIEEDVIRFHLHDLVRIYAAERLADAESTAVRISSLQRLLSCWLFITTTAHSRIYGGNFALLHGTAPRWSLPGETMTLLLRDPIDWFRTERNSLVTAILMAARLDMDELCWDLAATSATLFESGLYRDEWYESHSAALEVVRNTGNRRGEAALLYSLGTLEVGIRAFTANSYFERSLKIFDEIDDDQGRAMAQSGLALIDSLEGKGEVALDRYRLAINGFQAVGDLASEAYTYKAMAQIVADQLDYSTAEKLLDDALAIARRVEAPRLTAQVQYSLAEIQLLRGRIESAAGAFVSVLRLTREIGDIVGQAYTLVCLGNARRMLNDFDSAESALMEALDLAGRAGNRLIYGRSLLGLSELYLAKGEEHLALERADEAIAVFREHNDKGVWQAKALDLRVRIHEQVDRLAAQPRFGSRPQARTEQRARLWPPRPASSLRSGGRQDSGAAHRRELVSSRPGRPTGARVPEWPGSRNRRDGAAVRTREPGGARMQEAGDRDDGCRARSAQPRNCSSSVHCDLPCRISDGEFRHDLRKTQDLSLRVSLNYSASRYARSAILATR